MRDGGASTSVASQYVSTSDQVGRTGGGASVSAFADEWVFAEWIDSYTPDMIYSIAKAFVPEFTNEDASVFYDYDGYDLDVRCLLYLESSGTLLADSTELYNFAAYWEEGFSAS